MDVDMKTIEEEERIRSVNRLGTCLILGFLFPIVLSALGTTKFTFPNIEPLGKVDFLSTIALVYPLLGGIALLLVSRHGYSLVRPITMLAVGLFPVGLGVVSQNDFISKSLINISKETTIFFLLILSIIAIYAGSKLITRSDHISGRSIGGLGGMTYLVLSLVPFGGEPPLFFAMFSALKSDGGIALGGGFKFVVILTILVLCAYIYAALIAMTNMSYRPQSEKTGENAARVVVIASWAIPLGLVLTMMFSDAGPFGGFKMTMFTTLAKITLLVYGITAAIAGGTVELSEGMQPQTRKGGDLLKDINSNEINEAGLNALNETRN